MKTIPLFFALLWSGFLGACNAPLVKSPDSFEEHLALIVDHYEASLLTTRDRFRCLYNQFLAAQALSGVKRYEPFILKHVMPSSQEMIETSASARLVAWLIGEPDKDGVFPGLQNFVNYTHSAFDKKIWYRESAPSFEDLVLSINYGVVNTKFFPQDDKEAENFLRGTAFDQAAIFCFSRCPGLAIRLNCMKLFQPAAAKRLEKVIEVLCAMHKNFNPFPPILDVD